MSRGDIWVSESKELTTSRIVTCLDGIYRELGASSCPTCPYRAQSTNSFSFRSHYERSGSLTEHAICGKVTCIAGPSLKLGQCPADVTDFVCVQLETDPRSCCASMLHSASETIEIASAIPSNHSVALGTCYRNAVIVIVPSCSCHCGLDKWLLDRRSRMLWRALVCSASLVAW